MARPKKEINWDLVEKQMEAGLTAKQIAHGKIHITHFYDRFKEHFGCDFANYASESYERGDGFIKFTQYMKALAGNIPMLTLLGRERLNQGKEQEKVSPYEDILALRHENMILKAKLDAYQEPISADESEAE